MFLIWGALNSINFHQLLIRRRILKFVDHFTVLSTWLYKESFRIGYPMQWTLRSLNDESVKFLSHIYVVKEKSMIAILPFELGLLTKWNVWSKFFTYSNDRPGAIIHIVLSEGAIITAYNKCYAMTTSYKKLLLNGRHFTFRVPTVKKRFHGREAHLLITCLLKHQQAIKGLAYTLTAVSKSKATHKNFM